MLFVYIYCFLAVDLFSENYSTLLVLFLFAFSFFISWNPFTTDWNSPEDSCSDVKQGDIFLIFVKLLLGELLDFALFLSVMIGCGCYIKIGCLEDSFVFFSLTTC